MNTKQPNYKKELETAQEIAREAGKIMRVYFDRKQEVSYKKDASSVTMADIKINDLVIKRLKKLFPEDGIIGEEKSISEYGMGRIWFCDPIDGTAGFIWGTPTAMFSLALVVDGVPTVGVAFDPFLDRMYTAIKGKGSFCNGKRIKVSNDSLKQRYLAVSGGVSRVTRLPYIKEFKSKGVHLAGFSGAVYKGCLIAKGRLIGYIEHGLNAHDVAAVQVIVTEAGGKISGLKSGMLDYTKPLEKEAIVISNTKTHKEIISILKKYDFSNLGF